MQRNTVIAVAGAVAAVAIVGAVAAYNEAPPRSPDAVVATPGAHVATDDRETTVEAPFTKVEKDEGKTRVRAPFVDVEVPEDRTKDGTD